MSSSLTLELALNLIEASNDPSATDPMHTADDQNGRDGRSTRDPDDHSPKDDDEEVLFEPMTPPGSDEVTPCNSRADSPTLVGPCGFGDVECLVQPPPTEEAATTSGIESARVMNFDCFVSSPDGAGDGNGDDGHVADDAGCSPRGRSWRSNSGSSGEESVDLEADGDDDHDTGRESASRLSLLSLSGASAKLQVVKEKTQRAASQKREALTRFQKKGGLVGWLHGDESFATATRDDHTSTSTMNTSSRPNPNSMGVDSAEPRQRHSLIGNIYDKMKTLQASSTDPPILVPTRQSFHSTSTRSSARQSIGIHGFSNSGSASGLTSSSSFLRRDRSASSTEVEAVPRPSSRIRSLSLASRSVTPVAEAVSFAQTNSALQLDAFPLEDCLADPKIAAEFINTCFSGEEWLLTLLYSIDEFEALLAQDTIPSLESQVSMATTIVDRFLCPMVPRPQWEELYQMGMDVKGIVQTYQLPNDTASAITVLATALPKTLFDVVYHHVREKLREVYDSTFRTTREYSQLLSHLQQQKQQQASWDHDDRLLVLTFDQVLESEWCCTVFWVYLFRSSHHHRLSFIMDVKFKLRRLHVAVQQAAPDTPAMTKACSRVQRELSLLSRRYLQGKQAALSLPSTSPLLLRLKDDVCAHIQQIEDQDDVDMLKMSRVIEKLDAMRTQTRADFKRVSFERFSSFVTSALYRDFIIQPASSSSMNSSRSDDLMQLLRVNRISFHQTAVMSPHAHDLARLWSRESNNSSYTDDLFSASVSLVFVFRGNDGHATDPRETQSQRFVYRNLFISLSLDEASMLHGSVEHFLLPESTPQTMSLAEASKLPAVAFNFLAGSGENAVSGAIWRFGSTTGGDGNVYGVCIISRFKLHDSLRVYLSAFAESVGPSFVPDAIDALGAWDVDGAMRRAREAFNDHCGRAATTMVNSRSSPKLALPPVDFSYEDLFECMSIAHVVRLLSIILQEKKVVLVSSSYSILLSVGEALRDAIFPLAWSHVYVPVLPMGMRGYLHCPTPFIFGLHTSYARHCELPRPSEDLVVVNLDRDSVTGGGDVGLPPLRSNALRDQLQRLVRPRLFARDHVAFFTPTKGTTIATSGGSSSMSFPRDAVRRAFHAEVRALLGHLETFAFRFECTDRTISVVDASNKGRQWPADAARFYSAVLQSQAFSTFLGGRDESHDATA